MTLEEVMQAKDLLYLEPFSGFYKVWRVTGRYFYETALDREKESDIKVEIQTSPWPFSKKWVYLNNFKEVKKGK